MIYDKRRYSCRLHNNLCKWNDLYIPEGHSLADGELLWKETKYRINNGVELDEEEFRKEIVAYSGKEVRVRVI